MYALICVYEWNIDIWLERVDSIESGLAALLPISFESL